MWDYIEHVDYGIDEINRPGVCFGFSVIENALDDYEIEMYFNDLWPSSFYSLPD